MVSLVRRCAVAVMLPPLAGAFAGLSPTSASPLHIVPGTRLNGVSSYSPSDAWAVGFYVPARRGSRPYSHTLTEHWDGTSWTQVASPSEPDQVNILDAVDEISPSNVWAVGEQETSDGDALIEHWDGTSWTQVTSPSPGVYDQFFGVSAVTSSDVWAVGYTQTPEATDPALIEHWDGNSWKPVVVHDSRWKDPSQLFSVSAVSSSDAWAVGDYEVTTGEWRSMIDHWDGSRWAAIASANPTADYDFTSVSAESANDVWAVGGRKAGASSATSMIEHWDGTRWTRVASPRIKNSFLGQVSADSPTDAWTVGESGRNTLFDHWDGTSWTRQGGP